MHVVSCRRPTLALALAAGGGCIAPSSTPSCTAGGSPESPHTEVLPSASQGAEFSLLVHPTSTNLEHKLFAVSIRQEATSFSVRRSTASAWNQDGE
jgi:hypothetical protein